MMARSATLIRLLHKKRSDLGLHCFAKDCLSKNHFKLHDVCVLVFGHTLNRLQLMLLGQSKSFMVLIRPFDILFMT